MKEYIEREAVLALTHEIHIPEVDYRHRCIDPQDVREIPAADVVEVRHGNWIAMTFGDMRCSCCGGVYWVCSGLMSNYSYCPNCGTKMYGGDV